MGGAAGFGGGEYGDLVLASLVARRYFIDQQTRTEIAADLGLSRFKVARLLDSARQSGTVEIKIHAPAEIDIELSERIRDFLHLRSALVIDVDHATDERTRRSLGAVTAAFLSEALTPDDVLGLGWSRAAIATAQHIRGLPACRVVQLTGALRSADVAVNLVDTVDRLARMCGRAAASFYAPLIVSDRITARAVGRQPAVAEAFSQFDAVTVAVVGVGSWTPPRSVFHDAMSAPERVRLRTQNVLADISGVLIDSAGRVVDVPSPRQVVGISAAQLRAVPNVIGVAYDTHRAAAVHAACAYGYVNTLSTTASMAQEILRMPW